MQTRQKHNHPDAVVSNESEKYIDENIFNNFPIPIWNGTLGPGSMMEYGWYDKDVEDAVTKAIVELGLNREAAIVHIFNDR